MPNVEEMAPAATVDLKLASHSGASTLVLTEKEADIEVPLDRPTTDPEALAVPARSVHGYTVSFTV